MTVLYTYTLQCTIQGRYLIFWRIFTLQGLEGVVVGGHLRGLYQNPFVWLHDLKPILPLLPHPPTTLLICLSPAVAVVLNRTGGSYSCYNIESGTTRFYLFANEFNSLFHLFTLINEAVKARSYDTVLTQATGAGGKQEQKALEGQTVHKMACVVITHGGYLLS